MYKIAAVVILFDPDKNVVNNLHSYINQVDRLYVIDNSNEEHLFLIEKIQCPDKVEYIWNKNNLGIAAALNIGVKKAIENNFDYLLTMDQDSEASPLMVSNLLECFSVDSRVAVVSPLLQHRKGRNINTKPFKQYNQVISVWTSGNLVDLNIYKVIGNYKEDLFIDYVDHEFCLRLNVMGYKIYVCNNASLKHSLGKIEEINLFFRKVYPTNHPAHRIYYRTRNRFYLKKKYKKTVPDFFKQDDIDFWRTLLKVLLFEKRKLEKIKYFVLGYIDFRKNKFGKLNRN